MDRKRPPDVASSVGKRVVQALAAGSVQTYGVSRRLMYLVRPVAERAVTEVARDG